jgi:ABC-2 type transport system permease protein
MKLLSVLKKDLQLLLKDRGLLAVLFVMPLAFIVPISVSVGPDAFASMSGDKQEPLPVLDYDGGAHAASLIESVDESLLVERDMSLETAAAYGLQDDPACAQVGLACDALIAEAMLRKGNRVAALVIPAGFTAGVDAGEYTTVTLRYDPGGDAATRMQIEGVVKGMAIKVALNKMKDDSFGDMETMTTYAPDKLKNAIKKEANRTGDVKQEPALELDAIYPSNYTFKETPNTYQQVIPGFTVMFAFFIVSYVHGAIRSEKTGGTLSRLLSVPVGRATLLGGKLLSAVIVGVLQVAVMFAIGALAFGLGLGRDLFALALLTIAMVAAATGMGLAAAAFRLSGGAIVAPLLVGAALGGCLLPLDLLPPAVRTISMIVPHSWALNGYQNLMVRGQGLAQVLPQVGVLAAFAALFFGLAVWRFDFQD